MPQFRRNGGCCGAGAPESLWTQVSRGLLALVVVVLVFLVGLPAAATIQLFGRRGIISWGVFGERTDFIYGLTGLTFVLALGYLPLA